MAIVDILFNEEEGRDFLLELPLGALNPAEDILGELISAAYPVNEIPTPAGDGDIFIITE